MAHTHSSDDANEDPDTQKSTEILGGNSSVTDTGASLEVKTRAISLSDCSRSYLSVGVASLHGNSVRSKSSPQRPVVSKDTPNHPLPQPRKLKVKPLLSLCLNVFGRDPIHTVLTSDMYGMGEPLLGEILAEIIRHGNLTPSVVRAFEKVAKEEGHSNISKFLQSLDLFAAIGPGMRR
eukprot:CAMPEP_0184526790 /NCGR_PEP_ID=MMETSP0198_2-20121128/10846_1 /TAXON_ID=1112570 /ORGANISM="Thraustochytrium sp., Strain LLF1b" /LENGTH=177 /DNA_ID=CAMNT_0026918393 /DNA_START=206 /DNA_END=739 /DNA_ORIENTATION=-